MIASFARGGYTYTDAVVQHSVVTPATDTSLAQSQLVLMPRWSGLAHSELLRTQGISGINYTHTKCFFDMSLTGTLVGRRDDSDFLSDSNFGNSLPLPNRNLLGGYERLELGEATT